MNIVVVGSGLLGLSTAWYLQQDGHQVSVLDRRPGPALETSHANGSMLTPSMADPWNAPGVLRKLLRWIGREHAPLLLRPRVLPSLLGWGLRFLGNSGLESFRNNMLRNLRLARYSLELMAELRAETGIEYDADLSGTLKVFRLQQAFDEARRNADWLARHGVHGVYHDRVETVQLEPALAEVRAQIVGAIHYPDDETGDAQLFCAGLADRLRQRGARLAFDTTVRGWQRSGGLIRAAETDRGAVVADAWVLAAGSYSVGLAALLGLRLPIEPVKGYSITIPTAGWHGRPRIAVTDDALHAAVVPLGERLRVAGTAEFAGYDLSLRPRRIDNLLHLLQEIYPRLAQRIDRQELQAWAGLRPMSPDGAPILGRTPLENLFLNTGHGHLGWTMAAGSGRAVADLIGGRTPAIAIEDYALQRF